MLTHSLGYLFKMKMPSDLTCQWKFLCELANNWLWETLSLGSLDICGLHALSTYCIPDTMQGYALVGRWPSTQAGWQGPFQKNTQHNSTLVEHLIYFWESVRTTQTFWPPSLTECSFRLGCYVGLYKTMLNHLTFLSIIKTYFKN